jgi:hypothetical protein
LFSSEPEAYEDEASHSSSKPFTVPSSYHSLAKRTSNLPILAPRPKGVPASVSSASSDVEKSRGRRNRNFDEVSLNRRLACPYAKVDPIRFSPVNKDEKIFRGCSSCVLRKIAVVKNHLARVHAEPAIYCPTCYISLSTIEALQQHKDSDEKCKPRQRPFLTANEFEVMNAKRAKVRNPVDTWYDIFDTIFGASQPRPPDPYASSMGDAAVSSYELLADFQDTFKKRLSSVDGIPAETRALIEQVLLDTATDLGSKLWTEMTNGGAAVDASRRSSINVLTESNDVDINEFMNMNQWSALPP